MANAQETTLKLVLDELRGLRAELKARGTDAVPLEVRQAALSGADTVRAVIVTGALDLGTEESIS